MLGTNILAMQTNAFELELNTLALETNVLKTCARASATHTQLATSTASFQRLPNRIYADTIANHSYRQLASMCVAIKLTCMTHLTFELFPEEPPVQEVTVKGLFHPLFWVVVHPTYPSLRSPLVGEVSPQSSDIVRAWIVTF